MEHLTTTALARLVDEPPDANEAQHLAACSLCASELQALEEQTHTLAALPGIVPPLGDWEDLEAKLRSEGLIEDASLARRLGLARTPRWMPAAAAVVLFLGGGILGSAVTARGGPTGREVEASAAGTVEDAAAAVRVAEESYVTAVSRYRELLSRQSADVATVDPVSRYAALEHLVSVSQAAVRQAPGDPFLNGFLASVLAERDAAARMVSEEDPDNWF
jgi:hypothetical protein